MNAVTKIEAGAAKRRPRSTAVAKREAAPAPAAVDFGTALMAIIQDAARDERVDIDKMERLIAMQERVGARGAETAYYAALAEMQQELPVVGKRGEAMHGNKKQYSYAKWEDVNEAIKPILAKFGFGLSFKVERANGEVITTGILSHRMGHRETSSLSLPSDGSGSKNAVQAIGSSSAYGKRYTAFALLNITAADEDDDGNAAGYQDRSDNRQDYRQEEQPRQPDVISVEQLGELQKLIKESGADLDKFIAFLRSKGGLGPNEGLACLHPRHFDGTKKALLIKLEEARKNAANNEGEAK